MREFFSDLVDYGWSATIDNYLMWARMLMDATDSPDATGYAHTYLMNGLAPESNWTTLFTPGERRLRFINSSSMTFHDVRIPNLKMTVVQADGQNVQPVEVDEFRFGPARDVRCRRNSDRGSRAHNLLRSPGRKRLCTRNTCSTRGTTAPRSRTAAYVPHSEVAIGQMLAAMKERFHGTFRHSPPHCDLSRDQGQSSLVHPHHGHAPVKRSVNQDDVKAYHLFYADAKGSPGTDLTFFDWPVPRERRGTRSIVRTSLRVNGESCPEVVGARFAELQVNHGRDRRTRSPPHSPVRRSRRAASRAGRRRRPPAIHRYLLGSEPDSRSVSDPRTRPDRHQRSDPEADRRAVLPASSTCASSAIVRIPIIRPTRVHVFEMGDGGAGRAARCGAARLAASGQGAGGVHHVAFRTPDGNYDAWADRLNEFGIPNSGKVDRFWFRSLYVREPNGVLFEIATDGPGFAVDEAPETLGEQVVLPPFLEPYRGQIVANLKPID